jgi:hypothetical protein
MVMLFFVVFSISMLFVPNYFLKSASADQMVPRYEGEIIFPASNEAGANTNHTVFITPTQNTTAYVNTNHTVSITPTQNTTYLNTNHTVSIIPPQNTTVYDKTNPVGGFSNIVCKSGYEYVQMTGQYTAGNISYKVIFLQMVLLDNNGNVVAKGFGFVDDIDANETKNFNAITRYPSTFSSCIIQIDGTIPK